MPPIQFKGTYLFAAIEPVQTRYTYDVYAGSEKGKIELQQYKDDGYRCRYIYSNRYKCEKTVKGKVPEHLIRKLVNQYQNDFIDFERIKKATPYYYQKNEWTMEQYVLTREMTFRKYRYIYKPSDQSVEMILSSDDILLRLNAIDRWSVWHNVKIRQDGADATAKVTMEKLTP